MQKEVCLPATQLTFSSEVTVAGAGFQHHDLRYQRMTDTSIPSPHDHFFRESFARKKVARSFIREYLPPKLARQLDLGTLRIAKDSFIEKALRE